MLGDKRKPGSGAKTWHKWSRVNIFHRRAILQWLAGVLLLAPISAGLADSKPALMLAGVYRDSIDVTQYWISEKLDGVRARWDGSRLISRGGIEFAAPQWFIEGFPREPLDGELWIGRGRYEEVVSVVRKQQAHPGWRKVKLMLFDLPEHEGTFGERLAAMKRRVADAGLAHLQVVEQSRVATHAELMQRLRDVTDNGAEGLMLHRDGAHYGWGRSDDLLKLKIFDDAEAVVLGYRGGKGKYEGMVGSLKVRDDLGNVFYVGSGLSDEQRREPPPVGAWITFQHQGLTKNGIPRFPVFLRVRDEEPIEVNSVEE